jgi:hypothetical protein
LSFVVHCCISGIGVAKEAVSMKQLLKALRTAAARRVPSLLYLAADTLQLLVRRNVKRLERLQQVNIQLDAHTVALLKLAGKVQASLA